MRDDELSIILNKTRDYFGFIKSSLSKKMISAMKDEDTAALKKIEEYLKVLGSGIDHRSGLASVEHKSILSKCFRCLQRLDRIAKDYKLFQNGSSRW